MLVHPGPARTTMGAKGGCCPEHAPIHTWMMRSPHVAYPLPCLLGGPQPLLVFPTHPLPSQPSALRDTSRKASGSTNGTGDSEELIGPYPPHAASGMDTTSPMLARRLRSPHVHGMWEERQVDKSTTPGDFQCRRTGPSTPHFRAASPPSFPSPPAKSAPLPAIKWPWVSCGVRAST